MKMPIECWVCEDLEAEVTQFKEASPVNLEDIWTLYFLDTNLVLCSGTNLLCTEPGISSQVQLLKDGQHLMDYTVVHSDSKQSS